MSRCVCSLIARLFIFVLCLSLIPILHLSAQAATVDDEIVRYLKVTEPVQVAIDEQGQTRLFSGEELTQGKKLFEAHCLSCHIDGATLPYPQVSLSLKALAGAVPPRDNIRSLVAYFRHPVGYDGSDDNFWCREVPESWLSDEQVEKLAAFILRAAEKAPGWGKETF